MTETDAKIIRRAEHLLYDLGKIPDDLIAAWRASKHRSLFDFVVFRVCKNCQRDLAEHVAQRKCLFAETEYAGFSGTEAVEYVLNHWQATSNTKMADIVEVRP
jgi:hypothetical protein